MQLVQSEILTRDSQDAIKCYTRQNISHIFSIYAISTSPVKIGVLQYSGRNVVIDCGDVPQDIPLYITYFTDNTHSSMNIISVAKMVDAVYNKFWGRQYCRLSDEYVHEMVVRHINYLNRTKVNTYYNKQFCFSKDEDVCECLNIGCNVVDQNPILPKAPSSCPCDCTHTEEPDCCIISEPVQEEYKKRYFLPPNSPKVGILRFDSGEYVAYEELTDGIHLKSDRNIEKMDYSIGYWIPATEITSVKLNWKLTTSYDTHNNFIFFKHREKAEVCIEYVERYNECTDQTQFVEFDHTFWMLPVLATIVEIATDETDDRLQLWARDFEKMKREYTIITASQGEFWERKRKIHEVDGRYFKWRGESYSGSVPRGTIIPYGGVNYTPKSCNTCK
jgi:hypothetical protein